MNDIDTKDYIINLRVSRATYDKIKTKAAENRDTVSNLLRKVIEDSSEIMEDLSREIFGGPKKKGFSDIASYHRVKLAQAMECAECGAKLAAGSAATLGETQSGKKYYFCKDCKD